MKRPRGKSGATHAGDDDASLWSIAAENIKPLRRGKPRVHAALEGGQPAIPVSARGAKPSSVTSAHPSDRVKPAAARHLETTKPEPPRATAPPALAVFDRRAARKIRSGQIEIESRIDLHGMRQDEAHAALHAFLFRCLARDQRWVLVITGKGKSNGPTDREPAPFDMTVRRDRGILRRNVPRWLDEPELRAIVVSHTTAAIAHGGDGALYVHLRTKR